MESNELDFFTRFLYEAPGDDPPDAPTEDSGTPPDIPADAAENDGPPDIPDDPGGAEEGETADDSPPDMGGDFGDDTGFDDGGTEGDTDDGDVASDSNLGLDDKISAIMNMNLYQKYLQLLNTIGSELANLKNNNDILYTLSKDSLEIVQALKKLDENIRLYLDNTFMNENYSKNLLFFNKCLNLIKLLNDSFDSKIHKGIKELK